MKINIGTYKDVLQRVLVLLQLVTFVEMLILMAGKEKSMKIVQHTSLPFFGCFQQKTDKTRLILGIL